ncbi:mitochondrial import inner membrane translocase subunit Tim23-like [Oppia nitens]|uniref:mitochondrial import inner membrane translocase subunit Tim23-like n=1 Tax=Oppia nitens TaxID=1686743 RepID=UPI0023D9B7B1|nr:mitochondrial import inner membrane translocase subunit Tim23-like [Oppia nitens]
MSSAMDRTLSSMDAPFGAGMSSLGGYGGQLQSPYLQFDPLLLEANGGKSEFIFPDGGQRANRGRFELAFSQIGSSVMTGAGIGGAMGAVRGVQSVSQLQESIAVRRSQLLTFITKNGASMANTFGTIALIYSAIGVGLSFVQDSNDDINTVSAAVATGAIYGGLSQPPTNKRTEKALSMGQKLWQIRLKRSVIGSVIGLSASVAYVLLFNKDKYIKK